MTTQEETSETILADNHSVTLDPSSIEWNSQIVFFFGYSK